MTLQEQLDSLIAELRVAGLNYEVAVTNMKKRFIAAVLKDCNGHQCKAAKELLMHRNTLSRAIAELKLDVRQFRPETRYSREQAQRLTPDKLRAKELAPVFHGGMKVSSSQSLSEKQIAMRKRVQAQRDAFTAPWLEKSGA